MVRTKGTRASTNLGTIREGNFLWEKLTLEIAPAVRKYEAVVKGYGTAVLGGIRNFIQNNIRTRYYEDKYMIGMLYIGTCRIGTGIG